MLAGIIFGSVVLLVLGPLVMRVRHLRAHPLTPRSQRLVLRISLGLVVAFLVMDATLLTTRPDVGVGDWFSLLIPTFVVPTYLYWRLGGRLPDRRGR